MRHEIQPYFRDATERVGDGTSQPPLHIKPDVTETSWPSGVENGPISETSCQVNRVELQELSRFRFALLLRAAFDAPSDAEICRRAAKSLGCSEKSVKNWLNCTHSPPFDVVFAIGCLVGVFKVMEVMTQGQSRTTVLSMIVRGAGRVFGR